MTAIETIHQIQWLLAVKVDGIFGAKSRAALDAVIAAAAAPPPPLGIADDRPVDERSEKNIATLLSKVRPIARLFIHACQAAGIDAKVISGTRTYAEQDALYAKGRTTAGPKVTNARGGFSNHNFGIAFDIGIFVDGKYLEDGPAYRNAAVLGKSLGLSWGGDWTSFKDEPHYEYNPNLLTLAQMRERKANGEAII